MAVNYLVIIVLLLAYRIISGRYKDKTQKKGITFILVPAIMFVGYTVFAALIGLSKAVRYYSFVFIVLCLVLVVLIHRLYKDTAYANYIELLLLILALGGGIITSVNHDIEYLYLDEKETMEILSQYENVDIVMESQENDQAARHSIYDCVSHAGSEAKICPVTYAECHIDFTNCDDTLLIWTHSGKNVANCDIFIENGYEVEKLCSTYTSDIFIARR